MEEPEANSLQYIQVAEQGTRRFMGSVAAVRKAAIALHHIELGHLSGVELEAREVVFQVGSTLGSIRWEAMVAVGSHIVLQHKREFMVVNAQGADDQHCQYVVFAREVEESDDVDEDVNSHMHHQLVTAMRLMFAADL